MFAAAYFYLPAVPRSSDVGDGARSLNRRYKTELLLGGMRSHQYLYANVNIFFSEYLIKLADAFNSPQKDDVCKVPRVKRICG